MAGAIWKGLQVDDETFKRLNAEYGPSGKNPDPYSGSELFKEGGGKKSLTILKDGSVVNEKGEPWIKPPDPPKAGPDVASNAQMFQSQAAASTEEALPPLHGAQSDDLPPLQGPGAGGLPPLESDAALGLRNQSLKRSADVKGWAPLDASHAFIEPFNGMPVGGDLGGHFTDGTPISDATSETLRLASRGVDSSTSAEEPRKALLLARDLGIGPDAILGKTKEYEQVKQQEDFRSKAAMLPAYSQLSQWMAHNQAQANVLQKELDSWRTVDWLFGKYVYDQDAMQDWSRRHANGEELGDYKYRPQTYHEMPGWYLALGRATLSMSDSIQNMFQSMYGPNTKGAHDKLLQQINAQREVSEQPVPGETIYTPDEQGRPVPAGEEHPVLRKVNSVAGMIPLIGASMLHPALGAGMIYAESSGRTYGDMRQQGYDHEDALNASQSVGYVNAAIAIGTGGLFKFSFLPKATLGAMTGTSNAVLSSIGKNPTFWRAAMGLGKNFVWSTVMNMSMAANEASIREAYDSTRKNRPYDFSKVSSASADAADAWAEMLALSVVPAYKEHLARKAGFQANVERTADEVDRARFVEHVYNNYEARGQTLRSMHEASRIVTAVESLKGSEFMRTNPGDARKLIQMLAAPSGSQTVYLRPEAVVDMPPDMLDALGQHDGSLSANEGRVPVNIADLVMHPDAENLAQKASGGPDLKSPSELGSAAFDLPESARNVGLPDEKIEDFLKQERDKFAARKKSPEKLPTDKELDDALRKALELDPYAARDKDGVIMPGPAKRRPYPDAGPRERKAAPSSPLPPMNEAGLRRWALDATGRLPTSELQAMADEHGRRAEAATREALEARTAATEHAKGQQAEQTAASEARAVAAERKAAVASALHKALSAGAEEIRGHVDYFSKQASEEKLPGGGMAPRAAAWYAGEEFGAAHDAIMQATGLAQNRSYAATDLSDLYDRLARINSLPKDSFEGWDLQASNKSISERATMPERTLEDLRMLRSVLEQLGTAADAENSVRVFGIRVAKNLMREEIAAHLKNLPDAPQGQRMRPDDPNADSLWQGYQNERRSLAAELNKPSTLMLKLGRVGESLFFDGFVPASARENNMWDEVEPRLRELDRNTPADIRKLGRGKVQFPDGSTQLRRNVWDMVLKLGTDGADSKVARGFGFKDQFERGQPTITAEQQLWDFVHRNIADTPENAHRVMDGLITPHWKLFENYLWPHIETMFKERGLAPPEKLAGRKLTIHGKEFEGSYGGRLKWLEARNKPVVNPGSFEALLDSDVSGPYTDQRHLAARDPEFAGHPLFSWDGLVSDIRKEIHDVAMRPFLEDAHKVFSDSEIRQLVGNKLGKAALNEIYNPGGQSDWLHTIARGSVADVQSAKTWTQRLFKFQGLAAYSVFSLNTRVMAGQLSHIPAAMFGLDTNPLHVTQGTAAAFNPDRRSWAHAASEVLRLRYANYEDRAIELTRQLTGLDPGRDVVRRSVDHANWMAWREMDAFLSHSIWETAYSKAIGRYQIGEEVVGHDAAVRQADIAVTRMMPAQDIYDHSSFVRDRSVAGFSYMIRNFPNTLANVAALNWWSARLQGGAGTLEGAAARTKVGAQFVGMVLAAEILGKGWTMQGGPRADDDPEKWYGTRLFGAMAYPYMVGEPVSAAYLAVQGDRQGAKREMERMMPSSLGLIGSVVDDIGRFAQDGDDEAAMRAAAHLSGLLLKTPIPGIGYNLSNAARNAESPLDAVMKGMGYRR